VVEERFYSLGRYLKKTFGERVHKIRIIIGEPERPSAGMESVSLFAGGILDSAPAEPEPLTVTEQISKSKERIRKRFRTGKFIAYLHTVADACVSLETISKSVDEILDDNEVIGLTFCTRPESFSDAFIGYLSRTAGYTHTWLELGVISLHDETLRRIGVKHTRKEVRTLMQKLMGTQLNVAPHIVLGLPGESEEIMRETMREIARLSIQGINIHHFYVLDDTPFEEQYRRGELTLPERENYVNLVCDFIETLPPDVVLHRIVGEADRERLVAPDWTLDRRETLAMISEEMKRRDSSQGKQLMEIQSGFEL
jgi:hypothetical protein